MMFSPKNRSAFYLAVMVSLSFAACWVLLSLFFHPPFVFSADAQGKAPAFQCLSCFLSITVPFVLVFLLMRRQVGHLDQARSGLKRASDTIEERVQERTADLEKAMAEIKTLRGIITICANCKSIRNGNGKWESLESYLHSHTEAQFSHGLCKECQEILYGKNYSLCKTAQAD